MSNNLIPVLVLVGPTASGKTDLSIKIAKNFDAEIVSADSMQIYKEFNILTAKPSKEELESVKHHFIDEVSVKEEFSVADYVKKAHEVIKDVNNRGKLPMIVGGTGLYVDSLINNISFNEEKYDENIRKSLWNIYKSGSYQELLDELKSIDPESFDNIHPNNVKRVIRAIEFFRITGKPISQQIRESKLVDSPYFTNIIGINYKDRSKLYDKINKRIDKMLENGLIEEVQALSKINISKTAKEAIGYKEILPYLNGECDLLTAVENLKMQTRRYAKRQITWFNRNKNIKWFYIDDYDEKESMICDIINFISNLGRPKDGK